MIVELLPFVKAGIFWLLGLQFKGIDWDAMSDVATFMLWLPWIAWFFMTKIPFVQVSYWAGLVGL